MVLCMCGHEHRSDATATAAATYWTQRGGAAGATCGAHEVGVRPRAVQMQMLC